MDVTYEVVDRVAVVTIDRPEKRNAMSMAVFDGLREQADRAAADAAAGVVGATLVRGAGGVLSSGIDVSTFGDSLRPDAGGLDPDFVARLQASFTAYEDLEVPSVAQVEGHCYGAGLQLALACHVRLVAPDAQLSLMEVRWGLVPDLGGTLRLPRLVGLGRATELALTARRVGAEEALAMGLCERPLGAQAPGDEALAWAAALARGPAAVRHVPRLVRENLDRTRAEALAAEARTQGAVTAGPDFREAVMARMEGREPRFVGE